MKSVDQIFQRGDVSRMRMLFMSNVLGHSLQNMEFFRIAIKRWKYPGLTQHYWDFAFDLVEDVLQKMVDGRWGNELFCLAASEGCTPILQRLIASAQRMAELREELLRSSENNLEGTALHTAVQVGDMDIIRMLVEASVNLYSTDQSGRTPLQLAADSRNADIIGLLLNEADKRARRCRENGTEVIHR
jgi:hypothetical protein